MASGSSSKRIKTATSWKSLLHYIDPKPDDLDLEAVMSEIIEADTFIIISETCQQAILRDILGEEDKLIQSIIQSIKQGIHKPPTTAEQVNSFLFAPSSASTLSWDDFNEVLRSVTGTTKSFEYTSINDYFFTSAYESYLQPLASSTAATSSSTEATSSLAPVITNQQVLDNEFDDYHSSMLQLKTKEACGYPLLGNFVVKLAKLLSQELELKILAEMEFSVVLHKLTPGTKPACDSAVCAALSSGTNQPVILFEYKPRVDTRPEYIDHFQLMEVLLQGYYCLYQYNVDAIVHCLTDLQQWYYFKMEKQKPKQLSVKWYHSLPSTGTAPQLETHIKFLQPEISKIVQLKEAVKNIILGMQ